MVRLDISVVVHEWDPKIVLAALAALSDSLLFAKNEGMLEGATLWLGYNGVSPLPSNVPDSVAEVFAWNFRIFSAEPNLGYGGSHNRIMHRIFAIGDSYDIRNEVILIMNPDVAVETEAIANSIRRIKSDATVGFVCPLILDWDGECPEVGHKKYPSLVVLAARFIRSMLRFSPIKQLNYRYEYRDASIEQSYAGVELCSGCFLIARRELWEQAKGFDDKYFMYFEDFDLSLRTAQQGWQHTFDPTVVIRHAGGGAGQKNATHRKMFIQSAWRFFNRHGWRVARVGA